MAEVLQNYINGQFVKAHGQDTIDIVNPIDAQTVAVAPISDEDDVNAAFEAAVAAAKIWKRSTPAERQDALLNLAEGLREHRDELVEAQHRNTGQPKEQIGVEEVDAGIDNLKFFAGAARTLEGKAATEYMSEHTSYVRREPVGVVAQVTPWNYPLMMAIWKIGPALAAGNTIVLKPSDTTPESTLLLAKIAGEVLPAGVLNVVLGDGGTGALLTEHPVPAMVSITGSVRAGQAVAKSAAAGVKRTHLELGGKAPAVVFADADLERAAEQLIGFGTFNAGQDCTAVTRILVQDSVHDKFVELLAAEAKKVSTGSADDSENDYGPLNNKRHYADVCSKLENIPSHATVVTGGKPVEGSEGFFVEPTVISGLRQDDALVQEETFGPVLTVQSFSSEEEAVELSNDVPYALASSVWTSDHGTAMRVSRDLDFGCVWVNTHVLLVSEMPHGGFKYSGYGKDLSLYSVEEYTRVKHVMHSLEV
ncbi:gamma-aminobutyraldehyde dehydrogenase [Kocuria sp. WRN011]|uniref:Gamma-aminobutyraldehyde dehydrogenase n=2 Tax=Kocuria TaxID=57493 RepID=A0ABV3V4G5_9MICC|nr:MULTISPECIES: gamma-aminobutyraldehyde dehydrogenase [Kocuria]PBB07439.1 gamma-aminobutyraldehyde dehydrogenase [Kocuria sp. WRN011]